jgi:hypothetical protein
LSDLSNEFVIGDHNWMDHINPIVDGHRMGSGLIARDYEAVPVGSYAAAPAWSLDDMPLIPWEEMPERIKDMERTKSRISDIYERGNYGNRIPSLDQNGQGYCWAYSTAACVQALRAIANMPYVQLSAHSVACKIKNFRDEGAWGCLSLDFAKENGYVPTSLWPEKSMSRAHDNEANWRAAREFRVTEGFVELEPEVYDRDMSIQQQLTCLLNMIPVIGDFNYWGHSVGIFDAVDAFPDRSARDPSRYGTRIKNSWRDGWGKLGYAVMTGSKAFANGGAAPRVAWGG